MPYIKSEDRPKFDKYLTTLPTIENVGELNYFITQVLKNYMFEEGECYQTHNNIVGALECIKQEWYRRFTAEYEEKKIKDNGDIK